MVQSGATAFRTIWYSQIVATKRDQLLRRIIDDVAAHGLGDRSLRELAVAVGSSHRMLLYHFGSRDGLVGAIVGAVEAGQRDLLAAAANEASTAVELLRRSWQTVTDPDLAPFVQLFFEAVAYAARHGGAAFTSPWVEQAGEVAQRLGIPPDPVGARLGVAVVRGLLIDVITGDDPAEAGRAFERFVEQSVAPLDARPRTRPGRRARVSG